MKAILYKGEYYLRCVPGKTLFNSTMVHQVVNRGDVFALRIHDQALTILKGTEPVEFVDISVAIKGEDLTVARQKKKADDLRKYREQLQQELI